MIVLRVQSSLIIFFKPYDLSPHLVDSFYDKYVLQLFFFVAKLKGLTAPTVLSKNETYVNRPPRAKSQ